MTESIHTQLARHGHLPDEHLVDAGYVDAHLLVTARREWGVTLTGPAAANISHQSAANVGFTSDAFLIDWDRQQVTCPGTDHHPLES